jgi:hypothetical protein
VSEQLQREVEGLRHEVEELRKDVRDLVEAWRTARGVVRFVKVLGGVATAMTALWALVKLAMGAKA